MRQCEVCLEGCKRMPWQGPAWLHSIQTGWHDTQLTTSAMAGTCAEHNPIARFAGLQGDKRYTVFCLLRPGYIAAAAAVAAYKHIATGAQGDALTNASFGCAHIHHSSRANKRAVSYLCIYTCVPCNKKQQCGLASPLTRDQLHNSSSCAASCTTDWYAIRAAPKTAG